MEDTDKQSTTDGFSEEDLFMDEVVQGEPDLLYLDSYLKDLLGKR